MKIPRDRDECRKLLIELEPGKKGSQVKELSVSVACAYRMSGDREDADLRHSQVIHIVL